MKLGSANYFVGVDDLALEIFLRPEAVFADWQTDKQINRRERERQKIRFYNCFSVWSRSNV